MNRRTFIATGAAGGALMAAAPALGKEALLNRQALNSIETALDAAVAAGKLPGAVWLVSKGDEVVFGSAGSFDRDGGGAKMSRDTIFRIASMAKPIFAMAVMMLVEEGRLELDAPLATYLPELKGQRVLTSLDAALDSTVPAERPILVRHILDFTLGFGINFDPSLPIEQAIAENQLANGYPFPPSPHTGDEWVRRFGSLPLMAQPGATWMYNTGAHLQAVLIERVTGTTNDVFLKERIFDPLGMVDTGFWVPAEKLHRLPPVYGHDWQTGEAYVEDPADGFFSRRPVFANHTPGLVSTVDDYLAFARMLMNGGVYGGERLVSEASVAEMTRDQLTPAQKAGAGLGPGFFDAMGWGYGVGVATATSDVAANVGRYGWDGGLGTSWANDPATGLIGMLMTQSVGYYAAATPFLEFWGPANAAI